jgi:biopolymer transport protein ExbB/TolQ
VSKLQRIVEAVLRSAILWGLVAAAVFYGMLHAGLFGQTFLQRYCAGHPVAYLETAMFFVGLASLAIKGVDILLQTLAPTELPLGVVPRNAPPAEAAQAMLDRFEDLPSRCEREYQVRRVRTALEHVCARGSADDLDDELKYLADAEMSRVHATYGLFRIIIWAIPILGFLGTVIGITMALNGVDLQAPDQSMVKVLTGLGLKFDTTALALTLSMLLMFVHFLVERSETALLDRVDQQVTGSLRGLFTKAPTGPDGHLVAMRRMADTMIHAAERLVGRQTELWQESIEAAHGRWSRLAEDAGTHLQTALGESLKLHAREVAAAEEAAAEKNRRQWSELQQVLSDSVQAVAATQEAVVRRVEVLHQAVEATAQVARLEETLNGNLAALAGAKNFEETVMSLAAAIHLLTARLAEAPAGPKVRLESPRRASHAA